jgi:hypothetical protein
VAVHVCGHPNGRVTNHISYDFERHTFPQHQTDCRVPKFVRMPVPQSDFLTDGIEVTTEIARIDRLVRDL